MDTQLSNPRPSPETDSRPRIVVGVDSADLTHGAALWACTEAAHHHLPLQLVSACPVLVGPAPSRPGAVLSPDLELTARHEIEALADQLRGEVEMLPVEVSYGPALGVLLDHVDEHTSLLVVGRRGIGLAQRIMIGSTSIAVAGRSPVPVVVVPDTWVPARRSSAPIVAGVSLERWEKRRAGSGGGVTDPEVLHYAFEKASELKVPLIAVHAWEIPALYSWSPADIADFKGRVAQDLATAMEPWAARYPDVELVIRSVAERAADAVLDASHVAQLAVVGRHTAASRHRGFRLGSTSRAVLHRAETPVAVVPVALRPGEDETRDRHVGDGVWGPTF